VQAAFIGNHQADISATSPEGIALDVIGYDLAPVPEPSSIILWGIGGLFLAIGCLRRRPRPPAADAIDGKVRS
jgi:hypothetical protein